MLRKMLGLKCNYKVKDKNVDLQTEDPAAEEPSARYQPIGSDRKVLTRNQYLYQIGNDTVDSRTDNECQIDSLPPTQTKCVNKAAQHELTSSLKLDSNEYKNIVGHLMNQVANLQLNEIEDGSTIASSLMDKSNLKHESHLNTKPNNNCSSSVAASSSQPTSTASSSLSQPSTSSKSASRQDLHLDLTSIKSESVFNEHMSPSSIFSSIKSIAQSVESNLNLSNEPLANAAAASTPSAKTHSSQLPMPVVRTISTKFEGPDIYKMSALPRGFCLIINNVSFDLSCFETRNGSDSEAELLSELFRQLGFTVMTFKNLCTKKMLQTIKKFRKSPELVKHDAFVCIILSHGDADTLVGSDGLFVKIETIVGCFNNFNCPGLINKPRLFFIQACRGQCRDFGVQEKHTVADAVPRPLNQLLDQSGSMIPCWTDTLIVYSTVQGYVSMRNEYSGSWFGNALCDVLLNNACDTELYQLMMEVNKQIMNRQNTCGVKQAIECVFRGWNKRFFFNPGHYESKPEVKLENTINQELLESDLNSNQEAQTLTLENQDNQPQESIQPSGESETAPTHSTTDTAHQNS